ncbi:hypothetical protein [Cellulomonas carbonis]|uniref:Secreted protein n=1 Tax=Cellulomonas carbonis T26 TaxID=947969 RepID=A0A0A0BRA7_9CELL|nr:hypothetical protein [Cellulomonas carbonis]KGM09634.1 hypothetical protein N868_01235 [Cellulomonas carbonis T26]GGB93997.1 hypothetical protein GCM10010972_03340 [Cellulomonas carbonis]
MRRLFWAGVGAAAAVVAVRRLERTARRYTPAGVADRLENAGERTGAAVDGAMTRFQEARARRERELVASLLVTPEGGDPHAFRRRRPAAEDAPVAATAATRPSGRVDEDEPLYDF